MENNIFYTYIYLDPRKPGKYEYGDYSFEYEPFYVGKGSGKQYNSHLKEAKENRRFISNKHKLFKIKKILSENIDPIILKIKENLSEQEALDLEIWMICTIGRNDLNLGPLTNLTDGGEGTTKKIITYETRQKISKARKERYSGINHPMYGKKHSIESKEKMSESGKIKIFTEKHRMNMSKIRKGRPSTHKGEINRYTPETLEKMSASKKGMPSKKKGKKYPKNI